MAWTLLRGVTVQKSFSGKALSRPAPWLLLAVPLVLHGAVADARPVEDLELAALRRMSIEELMHIPLTTVSGVEASWFQSPAAVYVVNHDEVQRSGLRTLPEVLRLAPGVFVGRAGSHRWSIGTRGFNGDLSNKTLVQVDGRAVYDPLFGGTNWDAQDLLLDDVDRVEVIRGPGPTLWGHNAVNGVFSVTTRSARDTQGLHLGGGLGTTTQDGLLQARYGGTIGERTWYRVWGKFADYRALERPGPDDNRDGWEALHSGFRIDREGVGGLDLTIQGGLHDVELNEARQVPVPAAVPTFVTVLDEGYAEGEYLMLRVGRQEEAVRPGWKVQAYHDRTRRRAYSGFTFDRDTFDMEFRHTSRPTGRQKLIWGSGLRRTHDRISDGPDISLDPDTGSFTTISAFVQDTIALAPDRVFLMLGTKLEHNDYTDFEVQPTLRMWWTPDDRRTLWAAVTRAVRVPTRIEREGTFVLGYIDTGLAGGGPASGQIIPLTILGYPEADAEVLVAYELGHRLIPAPGVSLDLALFYNDYPTLLFPPPAVFNEPFTDAGSGESHGGELVVTWKPAPTVGVMASYSYVSVEVEDIFPSAEGLTPRNQARVRTAWDVSEALALNVAAYYVDAVPRASADPYVRLDTGLTWRFGSHGELSVRGQNLLESEHVEFEGGAEIERGLFVRTTLRF